LPEKFKEIRSNCGLDDGDDAYVLEKVLVVSYLRVRLTIILYYMWITSYCVFKIMH